MGKLAIIVYDSSRLPRSGEVTSEDIARAFEPLVGPAVIRKLYSPNPEEMAKRLADYINRISGFIKEWTPKDILERASEGGNPLDKIMRSDWNRKRVLDKIVSYLKQHNVPFLLNVYDNPDLGRKDMLIEYAKQVFVETKNPSKADVITLLIPDYEEDPPDSTGMGLSGVIALFIAVVLGIRALLGIMSR